MVAWEHGCLGTRLPGNTVAWEHSCLGTWLQCLLCSTCMYSHILQQWQHCGVGFNCYYLNSFKYLSDATWSHSSSHIICTRGRSWTQPSISTSNDLAITLSKSTHYTWTIKHLKRVQNCSECTVHPCLSKLPKILILAQEYLNSIWTSNWGSTSWRCNCWLDQESINAACQHSTTARKCSIVTRPFSSRESGMWARDNHRL